MLQIIKKLNLLFIMVFLFSFLNAQETNNSENNTSIKESKAEETKRGEFLGGKDTTMPSWLYSSFLDFSEDIEELADEKKRFVIFVQQQNCPYCHLFVNKNLKDENTKTKLLENFAMVDINMFGNRELVDVDGEELTEKEFAKKHNIQFTPTIIFYNENKKEILRLNGYVNVEKFNQALDFIKEKQESKLSFKDYLVQNAKEKTVAYEKSALFKDSKVFARLKDSKKLAVLFETKDCKEECLNLHTKLLKDKTTVELLKKIDLYSINLNKNDYVATPKRIIKRTKDWTNELNIVYSPTIVFFDEKGNEIIRIESMLKNFHFQSIVDFVVSDAYKEEKEFQRYLTNRANKIRDKGIDVNIWE